METGMTYKEKSAFASDGLPDPRFTNEDIPETQILPKRGKKQQRKTHRKRKSTLKSRKVSKKRLRRA
jgi:hypothetical protein